MRAKSAPRRVVIIGNGIAGVTTAMTLRRHDAVSEILLLSGESDTFFSRPALMYLYMGHMRQADTEPFAPGQWDKLRIQRRRAWVEHVEVEGQTLRLEGGEALPYDDLVIATGSVPNRFGWPGQDLERVRGLYTLQDLEALELASPDIERAVIVGGGLIGVELTEMLHSRGKQVTILARERSYWDNALPRAESELITRMIRARGVDLRTEVELEAILPDDQGRARAVRVKGGEEIACQWVGLTAGVRPNLSALEGSAIPTGRGVLVDTSLRAQVPHVFACGDCAEILTPEGQRNHLEQLWYTGRMQGEVLGRVLAGEQLSYDRGTWFNSAKFMDLEWHTYGEVPPAGRAGPDLRQAYWEAPGGTHAFRLVFRGDAVVGVNSLGIRYRQEVCVRWIDEGRGVDYVLDHLAEGNFDPELYRRQEPAIVASLREQLR